MWFQNRRAKFRRNERSLSIQNTSTSKILPKCNASPLSPSTRTDSATEKNIFATSPLLSATTTSDIQYVMPWKYPHYSQQDIYSNSSAIAGHLTTQSCGFLPGGPYNYFPNNIASGGLCNRMDVNGIRYRQDFNLTPQI